MKTTIDIDWRVWKDWHDETHPESVVSQLNHLLKPHGVRLSKLSSPRCDSLELEAVSGDAFDGIVRNLAGEPVGTFVWEDGEGR